MSGHRIEVRDSSQRVRVSLGGRVIADTTRAKALYETGYSVRWYVPREDISAELEPSAKRTTCPFKGEATHFDVDGEAAVAWSYEDPIRDGVPVKGLVAFYDERAEVQPDGER